MNTYTSQSTITAGHAVGKPGLFQTAQGEKLGLPFALITSLFLLWGFCNGMIDILTRQ